MGDRGQAYQMPLCKKNESEKHMLTRTLAIGDLYNIVTQLINVPPK